MGSACRAVAGLPFVLTDPTQEQHSHEEMNYKVIDLMWFLKILFKKEQF